jgi:hypothetical protein
LIASTSGVKTHPSSNFLVQRVKQGQTQIRYGRDAMALTLSGQVPISKLDAVPCSLLATLS